MIERVMIEFERELNYLIKKNFNEDIIIFVWCDALNMKVKIFFSDKKKYNDPSYEAPLLATYNSFEIEYDKDRIIEEIVDKINKYLHPLPVKVVEQTDTKSSIPHFCPCCGAPRRSNSFKCDYCDIEFF